MLLSHEGVWEYIKYFFSSFYLLYTLRITCTFVVFKEKDWNLLSY